MNASRRRFESLARFALVFAAAFGLSAAARAQPSIGSLLGYLFRHDLSIITVTDVTDAGRKLPPASLDHPVYFEVMILGYNDWGKAIPGHRLPDKQTMVRMLFKVLAEQGYLPATPAHPPTQLLAFAWGTLNPRPFEPPAAALRFMGADKIGRQWFGTPRQGNAIDPSVLYRNARPWETDVIAYSAVEGLFVASIQSFDVAEARKNHIVLLWQTKISCPTPGVVMDTALPRMIRVAGPNIGRDMPRPVIATAPAHRGVVELGELKVLETIDTSQLPVFDVSEQLAKARAGQAQPAGPK